MHYVVVVAWDDDGVVVHDPTRGPNQIIDPERFERVWRVSGYLTLLLLPPAVPATAHRPERSRPPRAATTW